MQGLGPHLTEAEQGKQSQRQEHTQSRDIPSPRGTLDLTEGRRQGSSEPSSKASPCCWSPVAGNSQLRLRNYGYLFYVYLP